MIVALIMAAVRLGKILLRWCLNCNIPILEEKKCTLCGENTEEVRLTPPGDPRPAFEEDILLLRRTVDRQFGDGSGSALFPDGKIVLLNKVPALDRMDEVIMDGKIIGTLRFDPGRGWSFLSRLEAARVIQYAASKGVVVADNGAVDPICQGKNLMAPGVVRVIGDIRCGDEVIVTTEKGEAIATGIAKMSGEEMIESSRGVAVKTRWTGIPDRSQNVGNMGSWDLALTANRPVIERAIKEAVSFIKRTMERFSLPAVVSFSGGKDSLACALLTMDAGYSLPLLFIDTGLEFKETVRFVKEFAEKNKLEVIWVKSNDGVFEESLTRFGPPCRDYRWCCKTNKLSPTLRAIKKYFPEGVVSFIGQRRYESESRARKPRTWRNPWVPGQVGAAPIQNWTSLHVWMYIFMKKEPYNPLYKMGLDRIGCFVCPAADLGELELIKDKNEELADWENSLKELAAENGLPECWVELGLWRWRRVPASIINYLKEMGLISQNDDYLHLPKTPFKLLVEKTICEDDSYRAEGRFKPEPDFERLCNILNILDEPEVSADDCRISGGTVHRDGRILLEEKSLETLKKKLEFFLKAAVKSEKCVGCGLCAGLCPNDAISIQYRRMKIIGERCTHCGSCVEPCPALSFGKSELVF